MLLPKYSRGFTLIELLVTMSIIAIIAGGIIPSFSTYVRDQNIKQAQEQLKGELRTIQNKALTGSMSDEVIASSSYASYWGVYMVSGSNAMSYFISTGTSCPPNVSSSENQGSFTLPNKTKYMGNTGCMFFSIKNGDISGNISSPIQIKFSAEDSSVREINFNPTGLIY